MIRCIGVGDLYHHDDGVGLYVAQRLRVENVTGVSVIEHDGDGTTLGEALSDVDTLILIAAMQSGAEPGTITAFAPREQLLPADAFTRRQQNSGIAEALERARAEDALPRRVTVYGIEGACFDRGMGLTPAIQRAARQLIPVIVRSLWEHRAAKLKEKHRR